MQDNQIDRLNQVELELPEGKDLNYEAFKSLAEQMQQLAVQDALAFLQQRYISISPESITRLSLKDSNRSDPFNHAYFSETQWGVLSKLMLNSNKPHIPTEEELSRMSEEEILKFAQLDAQTHKLHINLNGQGTNRAVMLAYLAYGQEIYNIFQDLRNMLAGVELNEQVVKEFEVEFRDLFIRCPEFKLYPPDSQAHSKHFSFVLYYGGVSAIDLRNQDLANLKRIASKNNLISNIPMVYFVNLDYDLREVSNIHRFSQIDDCPPDYPSGQPDKIAPWLTEYFPNNTNFTKRAIFSLSTGNTNFKVMLMRVRQDLFAKLYKPPRFHELNDEYSK